VLRDILAKRRYIRQEYPEYSSHKEQNLIIKEHREDNI
jgi:hypothetical protein